MIANHGVAHREKQTVNLTCKYSVKILFDAVVEAIKKLDKSEICVKNIDMGYIYATHTNGKRRNMQDIIVCIKYINDEISELFIEVQQRRDAGLHFMNIELVNVLIESINTSVKNIMSK